MRRIVLRIVSSLCVAAVLLAVAVVLLLRGSLPQYEGRAEAAALSAPVRVERDALGTVTLLARNRRDVSFALGYVHAQERFFEMDLLSSAQWFLALFSAAVGLTIASVLWRLPQIERLEELPGDA